MSPIHDSEFVVNYKKSSLINLKYSQLKKIQFKIQFSLWLPLIIVAGSSDHLVLCKTLQSHRNKGYRGSITPSPKKHMRGWLCNSVWGQPSNEVIRLTIIKKVSFISGNKLGVTSLGLNGGNNLAMSRWLHCSRVTATESLPRASTYVFFFTLANQGSFPNYEEDPWRHTNKFCLEIEVKPSASFCSHRVF